MKWNIYVEKTYMVGEQIKDEVVAFFEAVGLGFVLHFALLLLVLVAYCMFVRNHWRSLVVISSLVLWGIIVADGRLFA